MTCVKLLPLLKQSSAPATVPESLLEVLRKQVQTCKSNCRMILESADSAPAAPKRQLNGEEGKAAADAAEE